MEVEGRERRKGSCGKEAGDGYAWDVKESTGWLGVTQKRKLWTTFTNNGGDGEHTNIMRVQVRPTGMVKPIRVPVRPVVGLYADAVFEKLTKKDTATKLQVKFETLQKMIAALDTEATVHEGMRCWLGRTLGLSTDYERLATLVEKKWFTVDGTTVGADCCKSHAGTW